MDNADYKSLTEKLIQNGILSLSEETKDNNEENLFGIVPDENIEHSPFNSMQTNAIKKDEADKELKKSKKRLNDYDLKLIQNEVNNENEKNQNGFLSLKQGMFTKTKKINFENLLLKFFPRLYKVQLAREAMRKYKELGINVNELLDKTIPYGECESRYSDLVKYIIYANEVRTKINKKPD